MKITVEMTPKEIADLIVELQGQQQIDGEQFINNLIAGLNQSYATMNDRVSEQLKSMSD